jgi:Flp pilus assembly protein TadG
VVSLEFGIIAVPFFMWLLFSFELSYDLYTQSALDDALHAAVRMIQTGNAQYVADGKTFVNGYLCPAAGGRLECSRMYVQVQPANFGTNQDYYNLTTGALPVSGNTLVLTNYASAATSGSGSFCNASPQQFLLVSAIYVGPTFLGALLPGVLSEIYGGQRVHATLATTGIVTEPYSVSAYTGTTTPAASC